MWIDELLTFEHHINAIYKNTCSKLGVVKEARMNLDQSTALALYKSRVLDYEDVVYMIASKDKSNKLQLKQNVVCKVILKADRYAKIQHMHNMLGIFPLDKRRNMYIGL